MSNHNESDKREQPAYFRYGPFQPSRQETEVSQEDQATQVTEDLQTFGERDVEMTVPDPVKPLPTAGKSVAPAAAFGRASKKRRAACAVRIICRAAR